MASADNPYGANLVSPGYQPQHYPPGYYNPIREFDYVRALKAPFTSPNWLMNLVWMVVCELLAFVVIGNLLSFGYGMYVAEARSGGRDQEWPDFDFDKFSDYLLRGLWPFLWNLIGSFVLAIVVGIPLLITVTLAGALGDQTGPSTMSMIVLAVGGIVTLAVMACASMILIASGLRSGLANDFMKGADVAWISSFVSKMYLTLIYVGILMMITSLGLTILGAIALCVGIFLVSPILRLMAGDIFAQLHDIFVSRGGVPAFPIHSSNNTDVVDAQVIM